MRSSRKASTSPGMGRGPRSKGFEITLKQSFDPAAGEIDVFPQDITRALLNLIANGFYAATKRRAATTGGEHLSQLLPPRPKTLAIVSRSEIRDNGTGIAPDMKDKMFNPFFTTKPTGEGTGLGLSISHDIIVKQHAGSIKSIHSRVSSPKSSSRCRGLLRSSEVQTALPDA